jgi:hypothetical protein
MSGHDAELSRLRNENRNLQARLYNLQAENNTLRVQLQAGLSVISYLEQRLQFHLKSLAEQESAKRRDSNVRVCNQEEMLSLSGCTSGATLEVAAFESPQQMH